MREALLFNGILSSIIDGLQWLERSISQTLMILAVQTIFIYFLIFAASFILGALTIFSSLFARRICWLSIAKISRKFPRENSHTEREGRPRVFMHSRGFSAWDVAYKITTWVEYRLLAILRNFSNPISAWTLAVALISLLAYWWPTISIVVVESLDNAAGIMNSEELAELISLGSLIMSAIPWIILTFLLYSRFGRSSLHRNNSQLVADSTADLARLQSALVVMADAAFENRMNIISRRERWVKKSLTDLSSARVNWTDGYAPWIEDQKISYRMPPPLIDQEIHIDQQATVIEVSEEVEDIMKSINAKGVTGICQVVCSPAWAPLSRVGLDFRPSKISSSHRFHDIIKAQNRIIETIKNIEYWVPTILQKIDDPQWPRDENISFAENELREVGEQIDQVIKQHCEMECELWRLQEFLRRHVLGGRVDILSKFFGR